MSSTYEEYLKALIKTYTQEAEEHPERAIELLGRKVSSGKTEEVIYLPTQPVDASSRNGDMDKMDFVLSEMGD